MQPPEEQRTDVMRDFGNSTGIALVIIFCINGTAQLYSRVLVGRLFFGWMFFVGLLLQALYITFKSGFFHADAIPFHVIAGIHLIAFSIHGMFRLYYRNRGIDLHSYDPGFGLTAFFFKSLPHAANEILSDLIVTALLAGLFHLMGSPVTRDWYLWIVIPSLTFSHAWIQARKQFLKQKAFDAATEARHYSHTIHRR